MENKQNFLFGFSEAESRQQISNQIQEKDIQNLQKVVLQSFKYCQAKKSKNKYIRMRKIQEMKSYQKRLIAIVKKKSQQTVATLMQYSGQLITDEQMQHKENVKNQEECLQKLKEKICELKTQSQVLSVNIENSSHQQLNKDKIMRRKLKKITWQCQEELEKMESGDKNRRSDEDIEKLINQMQKPFKKLCNYFSILKKQIKEFQETETKKENIVK